MAFLAGAAEEVALVAESEALLEIAFAAKFGCWRVKGVENFLILGRDGECLGTLFATEHSYWISRL